MTSPAAPLSTQIIPDAVYSHDIPAERPWSRVLRQGQTLRIIDSEGQQAVDALLYCADNPAERYSAQDTLRVQGSAYVDLGTRLISAMQPASERRRNISMPAARTLFLSCRSMD